ncbi:hypothetical protein MML48_9g00013036 [Holotrichia oblita]|uniref:Uncharacterized protein n=1 Tax=Holotrichia oblita TaxID=644536 RepID=A0ACB9SIS6_HOLOL|nr:hypothetical protein MML48_9g00013036 [Holotrichia oblita]
MEEEDILIIQQILEDLNEAEEEQERPVRRFYNREDAFEISDIQFIKLFRLNKPTTREVINIASEYINEPSRKSATSVTLKVLIALHFYGHGTYQTGVGKTIFTAHRVLHYQPDIAGKIVNACVVLHNMCINNDVPEVDMEENNVDYGIGVNGRNEFNVNNTDLVAARQLLQTIADTHFQ